MTLAEFASGADAARGMDYRPGICNIGPAEIRRRRLAGHIGLVATVALLAVLVLVDAPPVARLLAILPAAASASGYLQAWLKFCAGFGSRGIFNFGAVGEEIVVADPEALAADRRRSRQIGGWALGIGIVVGVIALLLPI